MLDGRVAKRGECTRARGALEGSKHAGDGECATVQRTARTADPTSPRLTIRRIRINWNHSGLHIPPLELSLQRRHSLTLDPIRDDPVMAEPTLPAEAPLLASLPALPPLGGAPPTPAPAPVPAPTSTPTGKGRGRGGAGKGAARKADDAPDGEPKPKRSRKRPADGTGPG